jgi:hypothetical protein
VKIPDAADLSIPGVSQYRRLVEAPLFWEERARPKIAPPPVKQLAVVKEPEVVEAELMPPVARLVGIIDLGEKKYALVRNQDDSKALYKGDSWEGWTVEDINDERVLLAAGKQRTEVALIGDFSAPAANKQMLASRQRNEQLQQSRQQQLRQAQLKKQQHYNRVQQSSAEPAGAPGQGGENAVPAVNPAAQQNQARSAQQQAEQPAPVLSIKEALEARQRLMAARWGKKE